MHSLLITRDLKRVPLTPDENTVRLRSTLVSMHYRSLLPVLLISSVQAWLPEDHELAAFNQTARFEKLGRRWEPSLPSGVTKIRGVNFGGKHHVHNPILKSPTKTFKHRLAYL